MTGVTPAAAALRFLAALAAGWALWWFVAPFVLFPLHALALRAVLGPLEGDMIANVTTDHALLRIATNFPAPGTPPRLLDSQLEIRHFTLAMPLTWACVVALVPARAAPRALLVATLITFAMHTLVLAMQIGVAVPRLAVRQNVDMLFMPGAGLRIPWAPPPQWLLAAIDHVRITLVHGNLFILPAALGVWAYRDARRPAPAVAVERARPNRKARRASRHRRPARSG